MTGIIWLCIVGGFFACLGVWTFVRWVVTGSKRIMSVANDLTSTLKDATEIARSYREDLSILLQIAQSAPVATPGDEPESIIPKQEQYGSRMPDPYLGRFPIKVVEEDAPAESAREVDVTATDEEVLEQERDTQAADFETQERMKAATREADHARLKELADLSGEPEGK